MTATGRRQFIKGGLSLGCSAAAFPWLTGMTLAQVPGDNRLVVIVLRGAMDGLDVVQPYGSGVIAALRPGLPAGPESGAFDLDGYFSLHPRFGELMPLWRAGELAFAHAVSTPYRDRRSHFDGQDMLEAGTGPDVTGPLAREGWLNRMLAGLPGTTADTAFAVGRDRMRILAGPAAVRSWSPDTALELSDPAQQLLQAVYAEDPLFRDAGGAAMELARALALGEESPGMDGMAGNAMAGVAGPGESDALASFAAARLREETRIAAFSISGWDTHKAQSRGMAPVAARLSRAILTLKAGLGPLWARTTVLAMTEFGRTVRQNGSGGTDHGTGGLLIMAGGTLRDARVHGDWPGLDEAALYDRRDLMPTADVRAYAAWVMRGAFGLDRSALESRVFPGLDMGADPGVLA